MWRLFIVAAALAASGAVASASAQEVFVDDYYSNQPYGDGPDAPYDYGDSYHVAAPDQVPPPAVFSPRVYGWVSSRPANCGVFRYWNGERCADARYDPPPLDAGDSRFR